MSLELLSIIALVLAAIPCGLFLANLSAYRPLAKPSSSIATPVSVLIPARNEAQNILATLEAVLANQGIEFEVVVLDDHSTDNTAQIVSNMAACDARLRMESAPPLPAGWCGKQHACHVLARLARHPLLVFIDADVRLAPDALLRLTGFMEQNNVALASGVPCQKLGTISEKLLIPLIHFILLGFLPMRTMRRTRSPAFSAGCGQLFVARRWAYQCSGGHAELRGSLHDGIKLPRVFRRAGFSTDLFDATDVATCRMYHTNSETWRGLGKNATEGLAAPTTIIPMTALLMFGQVMPFVLLLLAAPGSWAFYFSAMGGGLALIPRVVAAQRFQQSWLGALLHPVGVLLLLGIQWHALLKQFSGRPMRWKDRSYSPVKAYSKSSATRVSAARLSLLVVCLGLLSGVHVQADSTPPEVQVTNLFCPQFKLADQFGTNHSVAFPRPQPMILIVADKQGSEQIEAWVTAIKSQYVGQLEVVGVADAGGAPGWVHGLIRKSFRKKYSYPILLDWSGRLPASLHGRKDVANVFLLDRSGRVLHTEHGKCDEASWHRLVSSADLAVKSP